MKSKIIENNKRLDEEITRLNELFEKISNLDNQINLLTENISEFYVYGDDQGYIQKELEKFDLSVNKISDDSYCLGEHIQDSYNKQQGFTPIDIAQDLKSLELAKENMRRIMADKEREFKRAKTVRSEYLNSVDFIHTWVHQAELRIQDRTLEPIRLKDIISDVQNELATVYEKLETTKQCAIIIVNNSQSNEEKILIQSTVDQLEKQIEQIHIDLEEKKNQLHDSLDAYARFMKLYEIVMKWAAEKRDFIAISLNVTTLNEARQKMNEYMVCKTNMKSNDYSFSHMLITIFH